MAKDAEDEKVLTFLHELRELAETALAMKEDDMFDKQCDTIAGKLKQLIEGFKAAGEKVQDRYYNFLMVACEISLFGGTFEIPAWEMHGTFYAVGGGESSLRPRARASCRLIIKAYDTLPKKFRQLSTIVTRIH